MAAAAISFSGPSHRIHTIHGAFGGSSCLSYPSPRISISPAAASSFTRVPNVSVPRGKPAYYGPVSRAAPATLSTSHARPRRSSVSFSSTAPSAGTPIARRAPPPPPFRGNRTTSALLETVTAEDPFADAFEDETTPVPTLPRSSRVYVSPVTTPAQSSQQARSMESSLISAPPGLADASTMRVEMVPSPLELSIRKAERDSRARLLASVLLSRAGSRPLGAYLRRRMSGQGQTYVKSGLSNVVLCA